MFVFKYLIFEYSNIFVIHWNLELLGIKYQILKLASIETSKHVVINQRKVYVEGTIVCCAIVNISKPSGFLEFKPHSGE